ncbi:hypothetical protein C2S52_009218 [Perilla frutescens var. hirtella]|nr:hypothetical protein C2S52_009218 [Perilla frutescens var. hirtella]
MDPTTNSTAISTVTTQGPPPPTPPPTGSQAAQVLEISLISAQDLTPLYKSMRTYAVAWINPSEKRTTRTDQHHTNPTWNDKFTFDVDIQALYAAHAALHVEIYTVLWFRHVLVGSVKVLVSDLLAPSQNNPNSTRFVALQIRRPSGTPQGILNMGVTFHDHSLRAMLRQHQHKNSSELDRKALNPSHETDNQENEDEYRNKIQLWRRSSSESELNHQDFPVKGGSVCNGSMVNGSDLCSDIGPSASIVAADLAMKLQPPPRPLPVIRHVDADDYGSSIVEDLTMEEAIAKGYRNRTAGDKWRKVIFDYDQSSELSAASSTHSRRNSDGGLFSCFVYGIEFRVACGSGNTSPVSSNHSNGGVRRKDSKEVNNW